MKEELLHYAWRTRRFDARGLEGTLGESIEIQHPGTWNLDSGPDFLHAVIVVNGITWAGHVEMHVLASDWYRHGHESDPRYDNVVLHVVWEDDANIRRRDGSFVPCLVMKQRIAPSLQANYQKLQQTDGWVPCARWLPEVDSGKKAIWLEAMLVQRLEQRVAEFDRQMDRCGRDAEAVFYQILAKAYGLKHNQEPMLKLAKAVPWTLARKYADDLLVLEALYFGVSGLLPANTEEPYVNRLCTEFHFLQQKHALRSLNREEWIFGGVRPPAFPTIRLAQWCAMIHRIPRLLPGFMACGDLDDMLSILGAEVSAYWQNHYHFAAKAPHSTGKTGMATRRVILINAVLPFLFYYGGATAREEVRESALRLFSALPPEDNRPVRSWKNTGMPAEHAGNTQALLHLKSRYCDLRACLKCTLGAEILKQEERVAT